MTKTNIQTLKGFRDFLPAEAKKRAWLRQRMTKVFEAWGYEPIESPTLEPLELFKGEIGEDEKLFYKFKDYGDRWVALRYDQTVPTARIVGQNLDKIVFPFRRYQIQSNFRAEKPQKGRFREFVQADIDIYGIASPLADAEAIAVSLDLYLKLGFKEVLAKINNRNLMKGIPYNAIASIDKLEKIGENGVFEEMQTKGISKEKAKEYFEKIKNLKPDKTLEMIFEYLTKSGFDKKYFEFTPTIARSFSYSEGPIWEIYIPGYSAGSVGGGERYDGLMKRITGREIPSTGIAFGFDRTLEALEQFELVPDLPTKSKVLVTIFSPDLLVQSIKVAGLLREKGINTELYPDEAAKLEKQLKYADKKSIPYVTIIGPEETEKNVVKLKDMQKRSEISLPIDKIVEEISKV